MSATQTTTGEAVPSTESFFAKVEAFGVAIGEMEITGTGTAKFSYPIPTASYSITEKLGRAITFTFSVDSGNFKVDAVVAPSA